MKIVFLSNYMSHHQYFLSEELYKRTCGGYTFVATEPITEERIKLGWPKIEAPYIIEMSEENKAQLRTMVMEADAVIIGSAPYRLVKERIRSGKLTFTYGERPYKKEPSLLTLLVHRLRYMSQYHYPNVYRLCASAFSPVDYARTNTFVGKSYRWGYFPEVKEYDDFEYLYNNKVPNSILWCGRFIDWKHPEVAVKVAKRLRDEGISFKMDIIGTGSMSKDIESLIELYKLESFVTLHGSMSPEKVREYMERSSIYLFTSDRQEGWGAVLNESMNSGCAVVANSAIGAVPFLIQDKKNGFIYEDGQIDEAYQKVKMLIENNELRFTFSKNAYETMIGIWNPKIATERFLQLVNSILSSSDTKLYDEGPCSLAPIIKNNWFEMK